MPNSLIIEVDHFHFLDIINLPLRIQIGANHSKDRKGEAPIEHLDWKRKNQSIILRSLEML